MKVPFCLLMTSLFVSIRTKENNVNGAKFAIENGKRVVASTYSTDEFAATKVMCAMMCISDEKCCEASYNHLTLTCRLDTSENCCVTMETVDGWEAIEKDKYVSESVCTGCISYGTSFYKITNDSKSWNQAKLSCEVLGGKLLVAETAKENCFIKNELLARNTVDGYWLGGYSFYKNGSFEWISNPGQPMTYSDMHPSQPNAPTSERCLIYWKDFGYAWGDGTCYVKLPYVCEFVKT